MNAIEWLSEKAPGFNALQLEERNAIMHFALLWSFFEAKVLDTRGSAKVILKVSKRWGNEGRLNKESFDNYLFYFRNRYFQNGELTPHFFDLGFKHNDNQKLVEAVLKGSERNIVNTAAALLIIVYRLRNNLFHGVKWASGIRGQLDNFNNANGLLMLALEQHGQL